LFGALKKKFSEFIGRTEERAEEKAEEGDTREPEVEEPKKPGDEEPQIDKPKIDEPIQPEEPPESTKIEAETPAQKHQIEPAKTETEREKPEPPKKEPKKVTVSTRVKSMFKKEVELGEKDLESLFEGLELDLCQSDVAVTTADEILDKLKKGLIGQRVDIRDVGAHTQNVLREVLTSALTPEEGSEIDLLEAIRESEKPYKILFLGVNGTGKTTTIAKIAHYLTQNGLTCVLAAGDTFRAGAIEQLKKHGENLGLRVISHTKGSDAAAVVYDAVEHAKAKNIDIVLADSAGRMQTNINLMDELKKIARVNKPDLKVFVGDALTGNDAVEQAKVFNEAVGVDAIILAKLDADTKGGCALSIVNEIKRPIILVGVGQGYWDLKPFDRDWFVEQII